MISQMDRSYASPLSRAGSSALKNIDLCSPAPSPLGKAGSSVLLGTLSRQGTYNGSLSRQQTIVENIGMKDYCSNTNAESFLEDDEYESNKLYSKTMPLNERSSPQFMSISTKLKESSVDDRSHPPATKLFGKAVAGKSGQIDTSVSAATASEGRFNIGSRASSGQMVTSQSDGVDQMRLNFEEEQRKAKREKDELLSAMEVLKMQNQLLNSRITKASVEAADQLEKEKIARIAAVERLEKEKSSLHEQLRDSKAQAEARLAKEKDAFLSKIAQLELYHEGIAKNKREIEEQAQTEAGMLKMQQAQLAAAVDKLEKEKANIRVRLQQNEAALAEANKRRDTDGISAALSSSSSSLKTEGTGTSSHLSAALPSDSNEVKISASNNNNNNINNSSSNSNNPSQAQEGNNSVTSAKAVANNEAAVLAKEYAALANELLSKLAATEKEKAALQSSLQQTEAEAKASAATLAAKLAEQQRAMTENLKQMQQEKEALAGRLQLTEAEARAQTAALSLQLEAEKETAQSALMSLALGKQQVEQDMVENEIKLQSAELDEATKAKIEEEQTMLIARQQELLEDEELALKQLHDGENEEAIVRQEHIEHEKQKKEDLVLKVQKMKEEVEAERKAEVIKVASSSNHSISSQSLSRKHSSAKLQSHFVAKRSLFDLMGDMNASAQSSSGNGEGEGGGGGGGGTYQIISNTGSSRPTSGSSRNGHSRSFHRRSMPKMFGGRTRQHAVETISEGIDEGLNFMDDDSDEDEEGESKKKRTAAGGGEAGELEGGLDETNEEFVAELPPPHAAAASGNLESLRFLVDKDPMLAVSLDSEGRQPLFYAAAFGHAQALCFLMEADPTQVLHADTYGDTALHAAAAAGHEVCVDGILTYAQMKALAVVKQAVVDTQAALPPKLKNAVGLATSGQIPVMQSETTSIEAVSNMKNKMGMTAAHMASTAAVMEVLYKFDAHIDIMDGNMRSPLFVACAMNRDDVADFVVNCLDHSDMSLLSQDGRGDTPLHAAACNGSVECLLLLLQYGIDPRITNHAQLSATDLAVANNHDKCRDVLLEYYLHYCTGSEFDSVLFLSTLQGYKHVSEVSNRTGGGNGSSSINIISNPQGKKALEKKMSMFSMRNTALRVQRWGAWIAYIDEQLAGQTTFWFNPDTGEGQWEKPTAVTIMQANMHQEDNFGKPLYTKMSMRLKKEGEWIQYVTEMGKTFYYHEKTGNFQWESPAEQHQQAIMKQQQQQQEEEAEASTYAAGGECGTEVGTFQDWVPAPVEGTEEWKAYMDPTSGSVFWYNHVTGLSQWECPFDDTTGTYHTDGNPCHSEEGQLDYYDCDSNTAERSQHDATGYGVDTLEPHNYQSNSIHHQKRVKVRRDTMDEDDEDLIETVHDHENDLGI